MNNYITQPHSFLPSIIGPHPSHALSTNHLQNKKKTTWHCEMTPVPMEKLCRAAHNGRRCFDGYLFSSSKIIYWLTYLAGHNHFCNVETGTEAPVEQNHTPHPSLVEMCQVPKWMNQCQVSAINRIWFALKVNYTQHIFFITCWFGSPQPHTSPLTFQKSTTPNSKWNSPTLSTVKLGNSIFYTPGLQATHCCMLCWDQPQWQMLSTGSKSRTDPQNSERNHWPVYSLC